MHIDKKTCAMGDSWDCWVLDFTTGEGSRLKCQLPPCAITRPETSEYGALRATSKDSVMSARDVVPSVSKVAFVPVSDAVLPGEPANFVKHTQPPSRKSRRVPGDAN